GAQADEVGDVALVDVAVVRDGLGRLDHAVGDGAAHALELDARPRGAVVEGRLGPRRGGGPVAGGGADVAPQGLDPPATLRPAAADGGQVDAELARHLAHRGGGPDAERGAGGGGAVGGGGGDRGGGRGGLRLRRRGGLRLRGLTRRRVVEDGLADLDDLAR